MKFLPKLYHTIRSYFTSKVELTNLIKTQLEITGINFRRMYEDNRCFPNGTDLKFKYKIFNMGVDFMYIFPCVSFKQKKTELNYLYPLMRTDRRPFFEKVLFFLPDQEYIYMSLPISIISEIPYPNTQS